MTYDIFDIHKQLEQDPAGAIVWWEEHYLSQVAQAAEVIAENRKNSPVVLLAGPSGSSKTTTATRIQQRLIAMGVRAHLLSMDNYYLDRDSANFPTLPDGSPDLESPLCLDIDLLNRHFAMLETGGEIDVPIFDFPSNSRCLDQQLHLETHPGDVFIFEGIHALNPLFTDAHPGACGVYVSPEDDFAKDGHIFCTPTALRLMRRVVRDYLFRGASAEYSLKLWGNVLESEQKYVTPYRSAADCRISSTLPYEIGVMKVLVEPLLKDLPENVPCRWAVDEVLTLLREIDPISASLVPEDSILREFIGSGK